ncbi:hypothetical protein [Pseudomonas sp. NW5]|nr:hypothetical protein [Pseudomonas sp. NW5]
MSKHDETHPATRGFSMDDYQEELLALREAERDCPDVVEDATEL